MEKAVTHAQKRDNYKDRREELNEVNFGRAEACRAVLPSLIDEYLHERKSILGILESATGIKPRKMTRMMQGEINIDVLLIAMALTEDASEFMNTWMEWGRAEYEANPQKYDKYNEKK